MWLVLMIAGWKYVIKLSKENVSVWLMTLGRWKSRYYWLEDNLLSKGFNLKIELVNLSK